MAQISKLPSLPTDRPNTSRWVLELTATEVRDIQAGGAASLQVVLPISDPDATITVRQAKD
jgi:hypothetical protein